MKDCLSCANSFSYVKEDETECLVCYEKDYEEVNETDCCDDYN